MGAMKSKGSQGPEEVSRRVKEKDSDSIKKCKVVKVISAFRRVSYPGKTKKASLRPKECELVPRCRGDG